MTTSQIPYRASFTELLLNDREHFRRIDSDLYKCSRHPKGRLGKGLRGNSRRWNPAPAGLTGGAHECYGHNL